MIVSVGGTQTSIVVYSTYEMANLNGLNPYYYLKYLLEEILRCMDEKGDLEASKLGFEQK